MDISTLFAFIAVATLLVISPGPNGLLITKTVPLFGKKVAFANIAGFVAAFYVHGTLSIFGISLLLVQSAQAFMLFKLVGAAYLIWLGVKSLISAFKNPPEITAPVAMTPPKKRRLKGAFIEGFLTNVLNPKVSMFYLAAFPQFLSTSDSPIIAYALVTAHSTVNLLWFTAVVFLLSRAKAMANNGTFRQWLNAITGIVFIGFGTKLVLLKSQ